MFNAWILHRWALFINFSMENVEPLLLLFVSLETDRKKRGMWWMMVLSVFFFFRSDNNNLCTWFYVYIYIYIFRIFRIIYIYIHIHSCGSKRFLTRYLPPVNIPQKLPKKALGSMGYIYNYVYIYTYAYTWIKVHTWTG